MWVLPRPVQPRLASSQPVQLWALRPASQALPSTIRQMAPCICRVPRSDRRKRRRDLSATILSPTLSMARKCPDTNKTFFVRITTYATNNATGSANDLGTVAASTAEPIILSGVMPESLVFCTGATVSTTSGVPDCLTATSQVSSVLTSSFHRQTPAAATSQMAASTNAGFGYTITVNGPTLTSGSNTIAGMAAAGSRRTMEPPSSA